MKHRLGSMQNADGSCYFEQGLNKVLVTVNGPIDATHRIDGDDGAVAVHILHAAFSGMERKVQPIQSHPRSIVMVIVRATPPSPLCFIELTISSPLPLNARPLPP